MRRTSPRRPASATSAEIATTRRAASASFLGLLILCLALGCAGSRSPGGDSSTELAGGGSTARAGGASTDRTGGDDSGIGGTGRGGDDSGLGGTGIYGTITAFGSIWVNGERVAYADDVAVRVNGAPGSRADLAVGKLVWIEAQSEGRGLRARSIAVLSAAIGPVTEIDREARTLVVAGRRIRVPEGAAGLGGAGGLAKIEVGDRLDVYGMQQADGRVVASRLDRGDAGQAPLSAAPRLAELVRRSSVRRILAQGFVGENGTADGFRLEGIRVELAASDLPRPARDSRIWVRGTLTPSRVLQAEQIRLKPPPLPDAGLPDARLPEIPDRLQRLPDPKLEPPVLEPPSVAPRDRLPAPDLIDRIEPLDPSLSSDRLPTRDRLR